MIHAKFIKEIIENMFRCISYIYTLLMRDVCTYVCMYVSYIFMNVTFYI